MQIKKITQVFFILSALLILGTSCNHEDNKINATCFDEVLNQEEVFIDCGGPNCEPCGPRCDNGVLDWEDGHQEYGIDCGGDCPTCCDNGVFDDDNTVHPEFNEEWLDCGGPDEACLDCETCSNGVHDPGETILTGTIITIDCDDDPTTECGPCADLCDDGLLNGYEDFIDCGGACEACDDATCFNEVLDEFNENLDPNINETMIDCGGLCIPCDDLSLCSDGYISGFEEAIDCGGDYCVPCNDASLCADGVQNGYETSVDCYSGTDGLSACLPCNVCDNLIYDGDETDTDCGGPDCAPCALVDQNHLTYTVTTDTESGVLYESSIGSITSNYTLGVYNGASTPIIDTPDILGFGGGLAHNIAFIMEDKDEMAPGIWGLDNSLIFNNTVIPGGYIDDVAILADDGIVYRARFAPTGEGVNVDFSSSPSITPIIPTDGFGNNWTIHVLGTFSGKLGDGLGHFATISGGSFEIEIDVP